MLGLSMSATDNWYTKYAPAPDSGVANSTTRFNDRCANSELVGNVDRDVGVGGSCKHVRECLLSVISLGALDWINFDYRLLSTVDCSLCSNSGFHVQRQHSGPIIWDQLTDGKHHCER